MKLTDKEEKLCKKYSKKDNKGHIHCHECPLKLKNLEGYYCKATVSKKEWKSYIKDKKEHKNE